MEGVEKRTKKKRRRKTPTHLAQQRLLGVTLRVPVGEQVGELVVGKRVEVVDVEREVVVVVVVVLEVGGGHGRRRKRAEVVAAAATAR